MTPIKTNPHRAVDYQSPALRRRWKLLGHWRLK
ncbi:hypothetical protein [Enterobacter phage 04_vB_Eclo_IJM]|nr:hypothetical protein [Enterobacter phage 04_vB_Eclo_IJM]